MTSSMTAQSVWAPFGLLALFVATLASWVAMDIVKRVYSAKAGAAVLWLLGAVVALGTGLWSSHIILTSALSGSAAVTYGSIGMLATWLSAVGLGYAGLACIAGRSHTIARMWMGSFLLAAGVIASSTASLISIAHSGNIDWNWGALGLAALVSVAGSAFALQLFFRLRPKRRQHGFALQTSAAIVMGASALLSQYFSIGAANLGSIQLTIQPLQVAQTSLAVLASVGSLALLSMMLVASLLEARLSVALREARGQLHKQSFTDALTELPNRLMFEDALIKAAKEADHRRDRFALLLIALDGFKPINESFGHHVGDRILRETAARLRTLTSKQDMVARLGGDEFLLLLRGNFDKDSVARFAADMLDALSQPCKVEGRETTISCSIGIAMYPENGGISALLAHADAAKRASKATGGATYSFFSPHMLSDVRDQVDLLRDLRRALDGKQFELYYQPKIHAPSGAITGAEALIRWHHPQRGMINPMVFIPIAERFGLINAIGSWVIDEVCRQAREWREAGLHMRIAINLSVHQLRQPDLPDRIEAALQQHDVNPQLLTCEITESVAMEDSQSTMRFFGRLADVGVHISIDDFGTGYSSLSYLRQLPAGELKIDRSFVLDLETSSDARAVVDAVVKLAQALSLKVVAEGVETEAQHQILRSLGCHELQGYLFAKPMSAKALSLWAINNVGPRTLEFRPSLFGDPVTENI